MRKTCEKLSLNKISRCWNKKTYEPNISSPGVTLARVLKKPSCRSLKNFDRLYFQVDIQRLFLKDYYGYTETFFTDKKSISSKSVKFIKNERLIVTEKEYQNMSRKVLGARFAKAFNFWNTTLTTW